MRDRLLAFRLGRAGLGARRPASVAEALLVPAPGTERDAVGLALAARLDGGMGADAFRAAVDDGDIVLAHALRGAIHGLAPGDHARFGRALLARDEDELARQLGQQVQELVAETRIPATDQLAEVADAIDDALAGAARLDRVELHAALRERVQDALLPWCRGRCRSHHVAPMLWRYASIRAGTRLDAGRRYLRATPGRAPARDAVLRFLRVYGPSDPATFAEWAGVANAHARRIWDDTPGLVEADGGGWLHADDVSALEDPPDPAPGVRLLPPGDPALARPNRKLLAPDADVRRTLFRPVASPGAVLRDGRIAGSWRVKAKGKGIEVAVEPLGRLAKGPVTEQAQRVGELRGAQNVTVTFR